MKQTRYRAFAVAWAFAGVCASVYASFMPAAKPRTLEQLEAQKKAIKEAAQAAIAAARKKAAEDIASLKSNERRIRAETIRDQKKRENHAKIVLGVAIIHQCQTSEALATKFKGLFEEFYADSPERLKAAVYGLTLQVKKPVNDQEQD